MTSGVGLQADNETLEQAAARTRRDFNARFGRPPRWLAAAPGRVNLIGEHVDYNDGIVMPMAVSRYVVVAAAPAGNLDTGLRVHSAAIGETAVLGNGSGRSSPGSWTSYIEGVYECCVQAGLRIPALSLYVYSNLPTGSGLSSSAALEVATATLLEAVADQSLETWQKIELCQRAEHEWAGVPCGIMDQASVVLGQKGYAMKLDCRSLAVDYVKFDDAEVSVLITNTQVRHQLAESPYARLRAQCETAASLLGRSLRDANLSDLAAAQTMDSETSRRARHVITEIERVEQAANAIAAEDWFVAGECLYASHRSLRDDFEVSCRELDVLVDLVRGIGTKGGVYGARMTGAGFGGCTVSLVETSQLPSIAERVSTAYESQTGRRPQFIVSRPADGAKVLSADA